MPLLIFSHGNSFPASTYRVLFRHLRARRFSVKAIEKFGHDPQYPVTNNWPHLVQQLADFTQAEVDKAGEPAFLVGHSLGGFLSLMVAARFPALARGVVMLDSPVLGGWRATTLGLIKSTQIVAAVSPGAVSQRRRNSWPDQDAALAHFQSKKAFACWEPEVLQDYVRHGTHDQDGQRVLSFNREVETAIYNHLPHNLERLLRRHLHEGTGALTRLDQAQRLKARQGLADHGAADSETLDQRLLGRQLLPGCQLPVADAHRQRIGQLFRQPGPHPQGGHVAKGMFRVVERGHGGARPVKLYDNNINLVA